jgi:hypothetical protein
MHVRRGDACLDQRPCPALAVYVEAARLLRELYGVSRIFLATDSQAVVAETTQFPDFEWRFQDLDRSFAEAPNPAEHAARRSAWIVEQRLQNKVWNGQAVNGYEQGAAAVLEVRLLADCDYFVGCLDSNLDRIVYGLMVAQRGGGTCFPPFVSVDNSTWFLNYQWRERRRHGRPPLAG